jgi:hypothetical protein
MWLKRLPSLEECSGLRNDDTESGTLRYVLGPGHYRLVVHGADGSGFNQELTVP